MTAKYVEQFVERNLNRIDKTDTWYLLYMQAKAARDAIMKDIQDGSKTAATDLMIFTIGSKTYPVNCWSADVISAIDTALFEIMQTCVEQLQLAMS